MTTVINVSVLIDASKKPHKLFSFKPARPSHWPRYHDENHSAVLKLTRAGTPHAAKKDSRWNETGKRKKATTRNINQK
jgi:hypothetical protein